MTQSNGIDQSIMVELSTDYDLQWLQWVNFYSERRPLAVVLWCEQFIGRLSLQWLHLHETVQLTIVHRAFT